MRRALAWLLLGLATAATGARAATRAQDDSLASTLQALLDRHAYAQADSLAREALPGLLAPGAPAGAALAVAGDAVLQVIASSLRQLPVEADSLAGRVIAIRRAAGDSVALAHSLTVAGHIQAHRTRGAVARRLVEEALRLQLAHAVRDSSALVEQYELLGRAGLMLEDPALAEASYGSALAIQERRLGPGHPTLGAYWNGLGSAAWSANHPAEAGRRYERALSLLERQVPPDAINLEAALESLMRTCAATGDLPRARRIGARAVAFADSAFGPGIGTTGTVHARFADVLAYLGEQQEAHRQAELGVAIWRRASTTPTTLFALVLKISAECDYDMGALDSAAVRMAEAARVGEAVAGPGAPVVIGARSRLSEIESERGHPLRALGIDQALWPLQVRRGPHWQLVIEEDLARIHRRLGHHAIAESLFAHIVAVEDSSAGPRSTVTLLARENVAASHYDRGDRAGAFALACRLQGVSREVLSDAISQLSDREAIACEGELTHGIDLLLTLASDRAGLPPADRLAAWDAVTRARLAALSERADQRRSIRAEDPEVARRLALLEAARDSLARVAVAGMRAGRADSLEWRLDQARRRRDDAERALAEVSVAYRATRPAHACGIAEVLAALPGHAALVSYVRYARRRTPVAADSGLAAESAAHYLALVHSPAGSAVQVVDLGDASALDALLSRWSAQSAHPLPARDTVAWRRFRELGAHVRECAWDPVAARLGDASRVFVVPDGMLAQVNLLALPSGRDGWLVEHGPALELLACERDLVHGEAPAPAGRGLLALGDPAFQGAPASPPVLALAANAPNVLRSVLRDADSLALPALPGSADEVRTLAALWRGLGGQAGDALTLLGPDAREDAFKARAPGRRVLHLATHGLSLAGRRVSLEPGARGVGGVRPARAPGNAPVRDDLAALALAGAGRRDTSGTGEDGWLTSEEVLSLDLSGVEWAVLSACETDVGDPRARESVQGLVRAFRLAGARTVIASLWPVDDRATREWMTRVYRARWQDGRRTADAVRAACLETLAERRARGASPHPFYWGAFVAVGSGE